MRGMLYTITENLYESETAPSELDNLIGTEYDYYERADDENIKDFLLYLEKEFGFKIGREVHIGEDFDEGVHFFEVTNKEKYFEKKYEAVKSIIQNMTLKDFADSVYPLQKNIEDTYGDAVYFYFFRSMDDFFRESEEGKRYYVTEVYKMH